MGNRYKYYASEEWVEDKIENHTHSWNNLKDKPFGDETVELFTWSGVAVKDEYGQLIAEFTIDPLLFESKNYDIVVNGIKFTHKFETVYIEQYRFNKNNELNEYGDYVYISISGTNGYVVFKHHDWTSDEEIPETYNISFSISGNVRTKMPLEFIPDMVGMQPYVLSIFKDEIDGWQVGGGGGTISEMYKADGQGRPMYVYVANQGLFPIQYCFYNSCTFNCYLIEDYGRDYITKITFAKITIKEDEYGQNTVTAKEHVLYEYTS